MSEFTCLTSCVLNVECAVYWQFKGGFPTGSFSIRANVFNWTTSTPGIFQNFTCRAENATTGISAQATKTVEVRGNEEFWCLFYFTNNSSVRTKLLFCSLCLLHTYSKSHSDTSSFWIRWGTFPWIFSSYPRPRTADAF